ncbi:MAG: HDOD domain-containing protein [Betaproteobacteria bacterium]|nr:HDOD domain-containing protein [Betaproteobacteria bacterium]
MNAARHDVDDILANFTQLPVLPGVLKEVIATFEGADFDPVALARKIGQDLGLSAKVLRIANSSFYGLSRRVTCVQQALVVMGFGSVRSIVLSAGLATIFPKKEQGAFDRCAFWRHSFKVGVYAKALAQCLGADPELSFTAGMFSDLGQLVLDSCLRGAFCAALERSRRTGEDLIAIEQETMGLDHAEVGAAVARRWNFPQPIEDAIRHWRTPQQAPIEQMAGLVRCANLLEKGLTDSALRDALPEPLRSRVEANWPCIATGLPEPQQMEEAFRVMWS